MTQRNSKSQLALRRHWRLLLLSGVAFFSSSNTHPWITTVTVPVVSALNGKLKRKHGNPNSRSLRIINASGSNIDIFWIHSETGALADTQTKGGEGVVFGAETHLSSYAGHAFHVQELPKGFVKSDSVTTFDIAAQSVNASAPPVVCNPDTQAVCRTATFACNTNEDQWVTIDRNFTVHFQDSQTRARSKAKQALDACQTDPLVVDADGNTAFADAIDAMTACFLQQAEQTIQSSRQEIQYQGTIRKEMGAKLARYSCGDGGHSSSSFATPTTSTMTQNNVRIESTPSILNQTYAPHQEPLRYLFASESNSIRLFENFATEQDCTQLFETQQASTILSAKVSRLLSTHVQLNSKNDPIKSPPSSIPLSVDILLESNGDNDSDDASCEVQPDGSCVTPPTATATVQGDGDDEKATRFDSYIQTTNETVLARIFLTCLRNSTEQENPTSNDTNATLPPSSTSTTGLLVFPKAGVRILPTHRSAVLVQYTTTTIQPTTSSNDATTTTTSLVDKEEEESYVDEHVVCASSSGGGGGQNPNEKAAAAAVAWIEGVYMMPQQ